MDQQRNTVLVTGATGQQGGHVARELLAKGHHVRALTRKPDAPAARDLARLGAEIVRGDFTERASLERAADGVDAIYGMSTPYETGIEMEIRQGITLAEVAKSTGKFLVFSSVAASNRQTAIPHFDSKWKVEEHMAQLGISATVLRPVYFMENLITRGARQLRDGVIASPLSADLPLQQIALADEASIAVLALENPSRFAGKSLDLASDALTGAEQAEILTRVLGTPIRYVQSSLEDLRRTNAETATMYEWFMRVGYDVDIPGLHRAYPEVAWHTFETWAQEQDWGSVLAAKAA